MCHHLYVPIVAVLLAAILFGTTGTAQALGPNADPASVGAARILIGGAALALVAAGVVLRERMRRQSPAGRPTAHSAIAAPTRLGRIPGWIVIAVGAAGILAYQPAFFAGTAANGVAVGTVVALGSAPVLTGAVDWIVHRRFPGAVWLVSTMIATTGVAVLAFAGSGNGSGDEHASVDVLGLLASVTAGASYAVYTIAGKELLDRGWSPSGSMGTLFGVAAALSLPVLLAGDMSWLASSEGLMMALWLGLATTTAAYLLFGWGLASLSAATVATLTLAEPLTASLLGVLVLHETLEIGSIAGLVILAAGIIVLTVGARRRRAATG